MPIEFLEIVSRQRQRSTLLQELSNVLAQAQPALLSRDLEEIHANTVRLKAAFCALQVFNEKALNEQASNKQAQNNPVTPADASYFAARHRTVLHDELRTLQTQIYKTGLQYAALVRRARRTSDLLNLALTNSALTYVPPQETRR
jgi:hypothetical protein